MVLVDTSIWIDFFQHPAAPHADRLQALIQDHNQAVICGIVLQEILQGIRDSRSYAATKERLEKLPYLAMTREIHLAAASLYRSLRAKGITVPSANASIAALAMFNRVPLYTKDDHFSVIAKQSGLVLYS